MKIIKHFLAILLTAGLLFSCCFAQENLSPWTELGTGKEEMTLVVVFPDLTTKGYRIHSDHPDLLTALLELELITVQETEEGVKLVMVDGCALPEDQPDAYWFLSVHDPETDALLPVTLPIEQLPFAGQTYAFGMINGEAAHE